MQKETVTGCHSFGQKGIEINSVLHSKIGHDLKHFRLRAAEHRTHLGVVSESFHDVQVLSLTVCLGSAPTKATFGKKLVNCFAAYCPYGGNVFAILFQGWF